MLSLALFALLLLASPSLSLSPRAYQAKRGGKAPRFPSGKYRPINANFVRRSPAGAAMGTGPATPGQELAGAPVNNITITPSNVVQCATATIAWTGAAEPVDLTIAQGGFYVGITPITTLPSLSGGSATWMVNQASGETLIFEVKDATGAVGYVQNIAVGQSGDASCISAASASASWSATASATDGSAPTASATAGDDGGDNDGDDSDNSTSVSQTASSTTVASTAAASVVISSSKLTTAAPTTTAGPATLQAPSSSASGDLGNAALAGALSASASAASAAAAKSGGAAVASVSFVAVAGGLMAVMSFVSL